MQERNTWPGWECVRLIGTGSFGKVYEIQREEFGKTYKAALKVITVPQNPSDIQNAYDDGMDEKSVTDYFRSFVESITDEFSLMAEMKGYTNIVSYEDHMVIPHEGEIGWDILIRMELLTPVQTWHNNHPLTEEDVIKLGMDICRALELCGKKNIIHRDVKPENIFINAYKDYKLGDFGIARTAEKTMSNLSKKGTYSYMAPEVYLGQNYGVTADIYSLGTVLYRYLNENRTPFLPLDVIKFTDREEALNKRMSGIPVPPPAHGSEKIKEVVLKAVAFNPQDRYQSATEFLHALESCLVSEAPQSASQEPVVNGSAERTEVLSKSDMSQEPVSASAPESMPLPQKEDPVQENTGTLLLGHAELVKKQQNVSGKSPSVQPQPASVTPKVTPVQPKPVSPVQPKVQPLPQRSAMEDETGTLLLGSSGKSKPQVSKEEQPKTYNNLAQRKTEAQLQREEEKQAEQEYEEYLFDQRRKAKKIKRRVIMIIVVLLLLLIHFGIGGLIILSALALEKTVKADFAQVLKVLIFIVVLPIFFFLCLFWLGLAPVVIYDTISGFMK